MDYKMPPGYELKEKVINGNKAYEIWKDGVIIYNTKVWRDFNGKIVKILKHGRNK